MARWKRTPGSAGAMSDAEARAWLRRACVRLFPTDAERTPRGWIATNPKSRMMLRARDEILPLRDAAFADVAEPVRLVAEARAILAAGGLVEQIDPAAAAKP